MAALSLSQKACLPPTTPTPDRVLLSDLTPRLTLPAPPLQLRELEDKYAECMEMLHEAQEELKNLRNKTVPNTTSRRYHSLGLFPMVSWAGLLAAVGVLGGDVSASSTLISVVESFRLARIGIPVLGV